METIKCLLKNGTPVVIMLSFLLLVPVSPFVHAQNDTDDVKKPLYAKGRFIVKFKGLDECPSCLTDPAASKKFSSIHKLNKEHGVKKIKSVFFEEKGLDVQEAKKEQKQLSERAQAVYSQRVQRGSGHSLPDLSSIFMMEVGEGADIEKIIKEYSDDPNVGYVQPDYETKTDLIPNDPMLSNLWGISKIQAGSAWDLSQGGGVTVAVLDTGVDYNHEDLAANMWTNMAETLNGLDDDGNGYVDDIQGWNFNGYNNNPMDIHGHGTHVAGIIAASGNNGTGIVGVAPMSKIMPLKGLGDSGSGYTSHLAAGIRYAALNGADVINNSWSCTNRCPSNSVVEDAVRFAHGLGVVVVFAAGNAYDDVKYYSPQNMIETIAVAASNSYDGIPLWSNSGVLIDVAAPGDNILSLAPGNSYATLSGTSMASPHTAGLAALILSVKPNFTNEDVRQVIQSSADDIQYAGFDGITGHGRINAAKALSIDSVLFPKISDPLNYALVNVDGNQFLPIMGTAHGATFSNYALSYGFEGLRCATKSSCVLDMIWNPIDSSLSPVQDDLLGTLDLRGLEQKNYFLSLKINSLAGNTFEEVLQFTPGFFGTDPNVQQITIQPSNQVHPSISGDRLVWIDYRNRTSGDIYLYDFSTSLEKRITSDSSMWPANVFIAKDKIVWNDTRYGNDDIYLYDLATGVEQRLTTDPNDQENPKIAAGKVIWKDHRHVNNDPKLADLYLYDIGTGGVKRITAGSTLYPYNKYSQAAISDNGRVYWIDTRGGIYMHDLSSGQEKMILSSRNPILHMDISSAGDKIVWEEEGYQRGSQPYGIIYLYDLKLGRKTLVHDGQGNLTVRSPRVDGDKVVFYDSRNGGDVLLFDISTGTAEGITLSSHVQCSPDISDNRIVWRSYQNDNWDIYTLRLPPVPVISSIGAKKVTVGGLLEFPVTATDPEGGVVSWTATVGSNPVSSIGATFIDRGDSTGFFSWIPTAEGVVNVKFTATNAKGLSSSEIVEISVTAATKSGGGSRRK